MVSVCLHMEGRSGDVVVAPLDEDDVGAPFLNDVVDGVLAVPPVFDDHLFAGGLRTVHPHVQDVVAGAGAVHSETATSKSEISLLGSIFFLFSGLFPTKVSEIILRLQKKGGFCAILD